MKPDEPVKLDQDIQPDEVKVSEVTKPDEPVNAIEDIKPDEAAKHDHNIQPDEAVKAAEEVFKVPQVPKKRGFWGKINWLVKFCIINQF